MATSNNLKFLLSSLVLVTLVTSYVNKSEALEGRNDGSHNYHTVKITSLLPSPLCTPHTKGFEKRQSTVEVIHRHGPCMRNATTPPSMQTILSQDQSRVHSLQSRIHHSSNTTNPYNSIKTNLPAQSEDSTGLGNYIITAGLGTPKRTLSLVFDTGSDLTWTQCQPCSVSCYKQQDPIFNPSTSTTYKTVPCKSNKCSELLAATGRNLACSSTCIYGAKYGDGSFSVGFLGQDKLTLTPVDVFPNFYFGCGEDNRGTFGEIAGLLGLGRSSLSLVSQTSGKYGKSFSYCLPSDPSKTGFLNFGQIGRSKDIQFTPFSDSKTDQFYFIDIISISVGGRRLPVRTSVFETSGTIVDSGTVISRIPPTAYRALRAAFRVSLARYPAAPAVSILDTCYDFTGYTQVRIPTIGFEFGGNVKINLDPSGMLIQVSSSQFCLAFAANGDDKDVAIFGNTQQKTLEVVYDVVGERLGFRRGGCE